ncbi:MAG: T9SS type A sorting domain-containing protein [Flavobacteriales bacterium]|nr:T9SS type A sorting domain-containing protein [Flavobacteriales bacterium]
MNVTRVIGFGSLIVIACNTEAQTYHAFPDSNAVWTVTHGSSDCAWSNVHSSVIRYRLTGDTVITGMTYRKVQKNLDVWGCWFTPDGYAGAIRNDQSERKVFVVPPLLSNEELLFDFSAGVGDTIIAFHGSGTDPYEQYVLEIDSVLLPSGYHRRWAISDQPSGEPELIIEGVGSASGLVPRWNYVDDKTYLACMTLNDTTAFEGFIGECDIHYGLAEFDRTNTFKAFPNPTDGPFKFEWDDRSGATEIRIMDATGRVVLIDQVSGQHNMVINASFSPGLYGVVLCSRNIPFAHTTLVVQ